MSTSSCSTRTLSIGELSERSGASSRMLRYYERQGLLQPARADNGYRRYDADTATTVAQILALLGAGLSTATIRQLLPCTHGVEPMIDPCPEIVRVLADHLGELDDRIRQLARNRAVLKRYLHATTTVDSGPDV